MKRKSIAAIHQQTLDILARLGLRRHTSTESFDAVVEIHNRYVRNICASLGVSHPSSLSAAGLTHPFPASIYAIKQ